MKQKNSRGKHDTEQHKIGCCGRNWERPTFSSGLKRGDDDDNDDDDDGGDDDDNTVCTTAVIIRCDYF